MSLSQSEESADSGVIAGQLGSKAAPAERFDLATFPHQPRAGGTSAPLTIENLEHLLDTAGIAPRYNVIKKKIELHRTGGSDVSMNEVLSLVTLHGMGTGFVYAFVAEIAEGRPYNPIKEWIEVRPWDGKDRLIALYATVREAEDYPAGLKEKLLYRWLLSATAAALKETRFRSRGVLTFQGEQGIGKTTWIASLLPKGGMRESYIKLDHHMDGGSKDSIIGAVAHFIVEMGELEGSFRKDMARLKGFLTNDCDKLRKPYAREEVEYDRRTVFAATVNDEQFLIDNTGNSRWWTIAVEGFDHGHSIDMQQVFAQLKLSFHAGEQWWLTPEEEAELAGYNLRHRSVSAIAERIRDHVDLTRIGAPGLVAKTAIEVLVDIGVNHPTNGQCKECGSALRELLGAPKRIHGRDRWRIPVRAYVPPSAGPAGQEGDT